MYGSQVPFKTTPTLNVSTPSDYYLTSIEIKRDGYIKAFEFFGISPGHAEINVFRNRIIKTNIFYLLSN